MLSGCTQAHVMVEVQSRIERWISARRRYRRARKLTALCFTCCIPISRYLKTESSSIKSNHPLVPGCRLRPPWFSQLSHCPSFHWLHRRCCYHGLGSRRWSLTCRRSVPRALNGRDWAASSCFRSGILVRSLCFVYHCGLSHLEEPSAADTGRPRE
jgi:hypothetical protein